MTATKTLYLIDGHAQFFRAYHAIRSGMTSPVTKEPTNMTFGFVGMLLKVLRQYKPDYLVVVIDAAGDKETFRSQIYPEYKATRKEPPDDLRPQIDRALRIMAQMGIPVIGEPEVEADDVIATLVRRYQRERPDLAIRIVSKDKDLTQLLNHNVELFDVHKDQAVTAADVFETPGLEPKHVVDVLTLMGDTVDNVPGVPGIGPKTAGQLILQYGSVENLLAHLDEIKGKRRENIEKSRDQLPLGRSLVILKDDVPVDFDLERGRSDPRALPVEELLATFRELGFNRFQDELRAIANPDGNAETAPPAADGRVRAKAASEAPIATRPGKPASKVAAGAFTGGLFDQHAADEASNSPVHEPGGGGLVDRGEYQCIRTVKALDALVKQIRKAGVIAIDTETTGLSTISDDLCGVCISIAPRTGVYIPVRSPDPAKHLDTATVIDRLRSVLEDPAIGKIGHNLKFDINVLRKQGVRLAGSMFDTMIASYVIDATRSSHKMDVLSLALLNHTCIPIADLIGTGKNQRSFASVDLETATTYAAEDADITYRLRDCMQPELERMGLQSLFADVEMPLVGVLAELEWNGIRVDPDELDRQRIGLERRAEELRMKLQDEAPGRVPFSPDSPKQLAVVLFNKPTQDPPGLGLKVIKRGKTGPSTDQEVLETLANNPEIDSPIPRLIVEYRQLTKLVNTYLLALKEAINPITQRIHTSFNQTVAVTGRLSSNDPNLQNIPIRTDVGREIRRAFVAESTQENWLNTQTPSLRGKAGRNEPNVLLTADYSQIELRILAHLSDDAALIDAFHQGLDIHTAVAAEVFGVPVDQVTKSQRSSAKMVNFGIVYGVTAYGLSWRLTLAGTPTSKEQAAKIISDYKTRFSRIAAFLEQCIQEATTQGYVETMLKRRRAIPQITSNNPQQRALGERLAINSVVQGSAADLIKLAMIDIHRQLPQAFPAARMVLQIHDELVFEAPQSIAGPLAEFVKDHMQRAMTLKVPLVAEAAWSANWIDAK